MARGRRRANALALTLAVPVLAGTPAHAQRLPTLHVTAVGMHADRASVRPGEAFHLTVRVHVAERNVALAPLVILPALDNLDDLGDERHTMTVANGTEFVEVLTLAARGPGEATLSAAYLDAIDARTGRPSRFSSSPLRIRVNGAPARIDPTPVLGWIGAAFVAVALAACALMVLVVSRRRRPAAPPPAPIVEVPPPPAVRPASRVRTAIAAFAAEPSEANRIELRSALFAAAGAAPGATLTDVLALASDQSLRAALLAAELAAFCRPADRPEADRRLISASASLLAGEREPVWTS